MTSPLDPEFLKIPAFKRKKIIQERIQPPPAFTVEDAMRSTMHGSISSSSSDYSYEDPLISSSLSRAKQQAGFAHHERQDQALRDSQQFQQVQRARPASRASRKLAITPQVRDPHSQSFGSISLQTSSDSQSLLSRPLRTYHEVGQVTALISKINVVIVKVSQTLRLNETLLFQDEGMMYEAPVITMQINRKDVKMAKKGAEIGMKMNHLPKNSTKVYRIVS